MKPYLISIVITLFLSCTKSADSPKPIVPPRVDETPLAAYINTDPAAVTLTVRDPQQKEIGYAFQALKKGTIYALGICMPQTAQAFKVTLWDAATKQIIKQKTITNSSSTVFSYIELSSSGTNEYVDIEKNRTYIVSVNAAAISVGAPDRQWYQLSKPGANANFLPITKGNIKILEGRYTDAAAPSPTFPDKTNFDVFGLHLLFGLPDIGFYATEY